MMPMVEGSWKNWMERALAGRESPGPELGAIVQTSHDERIMPIEFARTDRARYVGEIGKRLGDYIYHFYPKGDDFPPGFQDKLAEAFLEVFKHPDRLFWEKVDELNSWAVKAKGYAENPLADDLALRVFNLLDQLLEK